jgi:hypothetical protein
LSVFTDCPFWLSTIFMHKPAHRPAAME